VTVLADPRRLANEAIAAALRPSPPIDYLRFAEDNIVFGDGEPVPGPYNRAAFPYFDEILRALSPADPCRYVTFVGSAQVGKTVIGNIFALGSVHDGPGHGAGLSPDDRQRPSLVETEACPDDALDAGRADALSSALTRYVRQSLVQGARRRSGVYLDHRRKFPRLIVADHGQLSGAG